jgi:hypothetical protein
MCLEFEIQFKSIINKFVRECEFYIDAPSIDIARANAWSRLNKTYGDTSTFFINSIKEI